MTPKKDYNPTMMKGKIKRIFIDMDGVLADFFTEWGKLMGKKDWRDIGSENISKALEKIKQTENFWLDLPLTSNATRRVPRCSTLTTVVSGFRLNCFI